MKALIDAMIDAMLATGKFTCTCCGAPSGACRCWDESRSQDGYDRCGRPDGFGCVGHCRCPRCTAARQRGPHRVYIHTGTRHFAFPGDTVTQCGRHIPPDAKWTPAIEVRGNECLACSRKASAEFLILADLPPNPPKVAKPRRKP